MNIKGIQSEFPSLKNYIYLDIASRNPMSNRVRAAVEAYFDERQTCIFDKRAWFDKLEKVRLKVAQLLHASLDEIAFVKNTSEGINIIGGVLKPKNGDEIITAPDFEHPNNIYAWLNYRRLGVKVITLPLTKGTITKEQVINCMSRNTKLIALSSVSFSTGSRLEIKSISDACEKEGVFFLVDAAQSLGILDLNLKSVNIGALSATTSKGLLGMYGLGILYCQKEWADNVHPDFLARFSVEIEGGDESSLGSFDYKLAKGARRFEIGNYNYAALFALDAALDHILEFGIKEIENHVLELSELLTKQLQVMGFQLISPNDPLYRSHIVVFKGPNNSNPTAGLISQELLNAKILHSIRRDCIRISFHFYNSLHDVYRVTEVLRKII